jgi:uncharacterized protein YjiS (DUF1127 family)
MFLWRYLDHCAILYPYSQSGLYHYKMRLSMSDQTLTAQTALPPMAAVVFALAVVVLRWEQRQQTRRALNHLDGRLLTDIGLTAQGASLEGKKPFWQR